MTVIWKDVYSSNVQRVGYDSETSEMLVEWNTGRVSAYEGVDQETVEKISKSWSVGSAIRNEIKPKYAHRYR